MNCFTWAYNQVMMVFNEEALISPSKEEISQFCRDAGDGNLARLTAFLDTYANQSIDAEDKDGFTASMYAARDKQTEIIKLLLDRGASPHRRSTEGRTLLMFAVEEGNEEIIKLLLDRGAEIDLQENGAARTVLMIAASEHCYGITSLLLERGARLDLKNIWNETALEMAKRCRVPQKIIERLEQEPERRRLAAEVKAEAKREARRKAFSVFTAGLKKDLRTPKLRLKIPRRKP